MDCIHWQWKNCPCAWKGLYQGKSKSATVILEAVTSGDLWIWNAFFGTLGTCNDVNVLQRSSIFDDLYQGKASEVNFTVNGNAYTKGYYLTDGIYPKWSVFIPTIRLPMNPVDELFAQRQESVRKDVERAFGVLQSRLRDKHLLWEIMLACIILHNMIVEEERDIYQNYHDMSEFEQENRIVIDGSTRTNYSVQPGRFNDIGLNRYMKRRADTWDRNVHNALQRDLARHIWQLWAVYR